ncbi:MAG: hypothetical protein ABSD49_13505 [Candidatus Bathyarchaeia archaeon]
MFNVNLIGGIVHGIGLYTAFQQNVARQFREIRPFVDYDIFCYVMFARILLDRVCGLSKYFLRQEKTPSITSFNLHKKFFKGSSNSYGNDEEYAAYIRERTDWFDILKLIRDDFVVHQGPPHLSTLGFGQSDNDLTFVFAVYSPSDFKSRYGEITITLSVRCLAREISVFLEWFSAYGLKRMKLPHS